MDCLHNNVKVLAAIKRILILVWNTMMKFTDCKHAFHVETIIEEEMEDEVDIDIREIPEKSVNETAAVAKELGKVKKHYEVQCGRPITANEVFKLYLNVHKPQKDVPVISMKQFVLTKPDFPSILTKNDYHELSKNWIYSKRIRTSKSQRKVYSVVYTQSKTVPFIKL